MVEEFVFAMVPRRMKRITKARRANDVKDVMALRGNVLARGQEPEDRESTKRIIGEVRGRRGARRNQLGKTEN